jgi:hypothetical protein
MRLTFGHGDAQFNPHFCHSRSVLRHAQGLSKACTVCPGQSMPGKHGMCKSEDASRETASTLGARAQEQAPTLPPTHVPAIGAMLDSGLCDMAQAEWDAASQHTCISSTNGSRQFRSSDSTGEERPRSKKPLLKDPKDSAHGDCNPGRELEAQLISTHKAKHCIGGISVSEHTPDGCGLAQDSFQGYQRGTLRSVSEENIVVGNLDRLASPLSSGKAALVEHCSSSPVLKPSEGTNDSRHLPLQVQNGCQMLRSGPLQKHR